MPIIVKTGRPKRLLRIIKEAIDSRYIDTWSYDGDGHFTHCVEQWTGKAFLTPETSKGILELGIIITDDEMSEVLYGLYYGRFIEMLLNHFNEEFEEITLDPTDKI